jgi:ribosomal protein S27AE
MAKKEQSETELLLEIQCGRCDFTINLTVDLDSDGVYTIPNKFCPNCFRGMDRTILRGDRHLPKEEVDEPEDKATAKDPVPRPTGVLQRPQNGDNDS